MKDLTLKLTPAEAFTLRMVLDSISGDPVNSRRKHTASINNKLIDLGVPYASTDTFDREIHPNFSCVHFQSTD